MKQVELFVLSLIRNSNTDIYVCICNETEKGEIRECRRRWCSTLMLLFDFSVNFYIQSSIRFDFDAYIRIH